MQVNLDLSPDAVESQLQEFIGDLDRNAKVNAALAGLGQAHPSEAAMIPYVDLHGPLSSRLAGLGAAGGDWSLVVRADPSGESTTFEVEPTKPVHDVVFIVSCATYHLQSFTALLVRPDEADVVVFSR